MTEPTHTLTLRISPELRKRLYAYKDQMGMSVNGGAIELLEDSLGRHEARVRDANKRVTL